MEPRDWLRIQKNWRRLVSDVLWSTIKDDLISSLVIDTDDEQRINAEPVDKDKIGKLLNILKFKAQEKQAYDHFCNSLESVQPQLKQLLDDTEVPPLFDDGPSVEEVVRETLLNRYVERTGATVQLSSLRAIVAKSVEEQRLSLTWGDQPLTEFVVEVFSRRVTYVKGKRKIAPYFNNLIERTSDLTPRLPPGQPRLACPTAMPAAAVAAPVPMPDPMEVKVRAMTVEELQTYLSPRLKEHDMGDDVLDVIATEGITGKVFLSLTADDIKELFPKMIFGKRKLLLLEAESLRSSSNPSPMLASQTPSAESAERSLPCFSVPDAQEVPSLEAYPDYFRKFDSVVKPAEKYVRGRKLRLEPGSRRSLLHPVRRFVLLDHSQGNVEETIARETLPFAAAMLNERRNGTIYFGVNPRITDTLDEGEIVGMKVDQKECVGVLTDYVMKAFCDELRNIALKTIRDPHFVPTINASGEERELYVVEVDVVPSSAAVKSEAFFLRTEVYMEKKKRKRKLELYRLIEGKPQAQNEDEIAKYMKEKEDLTKCRAQEEKKNAPARATDTLRQQFLNLFAGGKDTLEDDVYPVLMLSPLDTHMDTEYIRSNLSFIRYIEAQCIFDFDPSGSSKGLYNFIDTEEQQSLLVLTTDNFDKNAEINLENKEKYTTFLESLKSSTQKNWVFCNGYECMDKPAMDPHDWKTARSEGFREALRLYHEDIPKGRGIVVFFLFSKNYEIMLEVADEILVKFQQQWMVLAETEAIVELWKEKLADRKWKKSELDERCVVGMPWKQVNATFHQILKPQVSAICELPTSTGAFIRLRERDRNDWNDIEILSRNECDNTEISSNRVQREQKRQEVEENFFRGGEVQWWNFWYKEDHVLKRAIHGNLQHTVEKALQEDEEGEDKVGVVMLLHQPGAGGSTSARQILWNLKDKYRCCVVHKITDQTCDQIASLRLYEEQDNPKPCLVLLDNQDEDKVSQLRAQLEDKARIMARQYEEPMGVFFVLLVCIRRSNLPKQAVGGKIFLRQELTENELGWFKRKFDTLEKRFLEDRLVDPKFLISFNILKENFNPDYIQRTVSEIIKDIEDDRELKLLKYLSLLNAFDIDFHSVPVSCFDPVMAREQAKPDKFLLRFGTVSRPTRTVGWECYMSSSLRILLNQSSQRSQRLHGSAVRALRLTNPLLSRQILTCIREKSNEPVSEIMSEFLGSSIFRYLNHNVWQLLQIIISIVKRREIGKDGRPERFSPFILEVMEKEDIDAAGRVLEQVFDRTEDAIIAQQTARFYIRTKHWKKAEHFAKIATNKKPSSSFMWDTRGQVYKEQVFDMLRQAKETEKKFNQVEAKQVIDLSKNAIEIFRREQELSERERSRMTNNAGYYNEIRVVVFLLNAFSMFECFQDRRDLHQFLVDPRYTPEKIKFLEAEDRSTIKRLHVDSSNLLRKLEDRMNQLKDDTSDMIQRKFVGEGAEALISLKENLDVYFGEDTDRVPEDMDPAQACEFRRRRASRLGGTHVGSALKNRFHPESTKRYVSVIKLMGENITTDFCKPVDYVTLINAVLALNAVSPTAASQIHIGHLREWSMKLFERRNEDEEPILEAYLYFVLFNFPTPPRIHNTACSTSMIPEAIKQWKEAFNRKYPRLLQEERWQRKRDTTFFFLGNGENMDEVVFYEEFHGMAGKKVIRGDRFWQTEQALKRLRRFQGTLQRDGLDVIIQVESAEGNKYNISLPTSMPISKRSLWQKRVFFVLGLSWSGPKAFDITQEDPSMQQRMAVPRGAGAARAGNGKRPGNGASLERSRSVQEMPTMDRLWEHLRQVTREIRLLETLPRLNAQQHEEKKRLEERKAELLQIQDDLLGDTQ